MVACCGNNCGTCVAYFGYTMTGKKRKHACAGCWSRDGLCAFIKQKCNKLATNQVRYCFECSGFPCDTLETLDERYKEKYGISVVENLKFIQSNGMDEFLKREQQKWKCPTCGGVICVHTKRCYACNP
ncbi:MAG: DUF3795 domain-containing protein [Candidatus Bathyarchaeia archaeon]